MLGQKGESSPSIVRAFLCPKKPLVFQRFRKAFLR